MKDQLFSIIFILQKPLEKKDSELKIASEKNKV